MLAGLTREEREDLDLRVFWANTSPVLHPLWNSTLLNLIDQSISAKEVVTEDQFKQLQQLETDRAFHQKTSLDFSYALKDCHEHSDSPYIALFEDDVLLAEGWLARSRVALRAISDRVKEQESSWLDMRLFNEERSIGWESRDMLGNHVPMIALGLAFLFVGFVSALQKFTKVVIMRSSTLIFASCVSIPIATIVFFQAGKTSLLPSQQGVSIQNWGPCTQGLIMPRAQVMGLVNELSAAASLKPADIIVMDYASKKGLNRWVLNPIQIQHIGESTRSPLRRY